MKKNIILIAIAFLMFANVAIFAAKTSAVNYVTPKIQDGLQEKFGSVQNVAWTMRPDNQIVASFKLNDRDVQAYFDIDGNYSYCTTNLDKQKLPLKVSLAANKKFENPNIRAVLEMSNNEGTTYFIMASDTNGKMKIWKAYDNGQIEFFRNI